MHGNPVFPIKIRKIITSSSSGALLNDTIEFGVSVDPMSLNADPAVKMAHQPLDTPISPTTLPYCGCDRITQTSEMIPNRWNTTKYPTQ